MDAGIEKAADLVELQVQLARWQFSWSNIWEDDGQRMNEEIFVLGYFFFIRKSYANYLP
jgi:hypothetical protein